MNYPSIKTLQTRLNIDKQTANQVRGLMQGAIDPETIDAVKQWVRQCYNMPAQDELIMCAIDAVLSNYGVESLGENLGKFYRYAPQYSYSNTGETYAATVVLDNATGRFIVSDIGYLIESGKVKSD